MDTFFKLLKKSMVATVFVMFALAATYIPQSWDDVKQVHAGPGVGGATEPTQILNKIQLAAVNAATTVTASAAPIIQWATTNLWVKENILDGIAWAIAKQIVSSMVQSLINWINSGFQGSPMFVQDLQGFLLQAADQAVGEFIQDIGGVGSFICSPFQLDVQVSIAMQYAQGGARDQNPAPTCTLSGIINNIENFIAGSFQGNGGWNDWFDITSNPEQYTPYGSLLTAEAGARARIINAQGEEITLLDFGDGFLSGEICEVVSGPGGSREDCFISKPGKIIEEALSFNLDSGRQSLIAADEINEIIAALLGQLANTALQGASGLLGLSSGTGYTYSGFSGGSYVDEMTQQSAGQISTSTAVALMQDALNVQTAYNNLATDYLTAPDPDLVTYANAPGRSAGNKANAENAIDAATKIQSDTATAIATLPGLITEMQDPTTSATRQNEIMQEYSALRLYSEPDITASQQAWDNILQQ